MLANKKARRKEAITADLVGSGNCGLGDVPFRLSNAREREEFPGKMKAHRRVGIGDCHPFRVWTHNQ